MAYADARDEIYAQIAAVSGIGKVFKSKRFVSDWATFLSRFKTSDGKINVCWFARTAGTERGDGIGSIDAAGELLVVD